MRKGDQRLAEPACADTVTLSNSEQNNGPVSGVGERHVVCLPISQREERLPTTPAQRIKTPTCGNESLARYKVIHAASRMITNRRFR